VDASKTGRHFSGFFRIYDRVVRQKPGSTCWSKSDFLVREFLSVTKADILVECCGISFAEIYVANESSFQFDESSQHK
jgi:hypothetical protein